MKELHIDTLFMHLTLLQRDILEVIRKGNGNIVPTPDIQAAVSKRQKYDVDRNTIYGVVYMINKKAGVKLIESAGNRKRKDANKRCLSGYRDSLVHWVPNSGVVRPPVRTRLNLVHQIKTFPIDSTHDTYRKT